jgi:hypothetical protein
MNNRRLVLGAAIDQGVSHGTVAASTCECGDAPAAECREFQGWLELGAVLEAMLDPSSMRRPRGCEADSDWDLAVDYRPSQRPLDPTTYVRSHIPVGGCW